MDLECSLLLMSARWGGVEAQELWRVWSSDPIEPSERRKFLYHVSQRRETTEEAAAEDGHPLSFLPLLSSRITHPTTTEQRARGDEKESTIAIISFRILLVD